MQAEADNEQIRLTRICEDYALICKQSAAEINDLRKRIKQLERLLEVLGWEQTGQTTPDPRQPEIATKIYYQLSTESTESIASQGELFDL